MMQDFVDFCLKGLFLLSTPLKVSKQGINSSISLALTIIDLELVMKEFLSPADLFGAQTLYVHELLEVVMVGKHENFMLRAL